MNTNDKVVSTKEMAQRSGSTGLTIWDLFNRPLNSFGDFMPIMRQPALKTDIKENAQGYELTVDLPGVPREDIKLDFADGVLTLSISRSSSGEVNENGYLLHERRQDSVTRRYTFEDADPEGIEAELKDGVLKLKLNKRAECRRTAIEIK